MRFSATEPGIQKAWRPMPRVEAISTALVWPFFRATAAPTI
ncbi:hypothetical protein H206_06342 [Candidatus Electrothrix aarhusensis]|uniref:Uncharacterized protein n=1 Tax=Candidatus Electrothrix aarhusensis TaxID=1859131 RepID=A0A444J2V9_9BACT|nr:hypothetical protein H206_06342 [Candidatus Electrothrix aarhusensis]